RKLGYKVETCDDANCYQFENTCSADSATDNFHCSDQAEYEREKAMDAIQLRRYVNDGFRKIKLDTSYDLTITNTQDVFMIQVETHARSKLSDTCTVLVFENTSPEDEAAVDKFLDYLEENFDDYLIYVVEGQVCRLRSVLLRKFTQHIWYKSPVDQFCD